MTEANEGGNLDADFDDADPTEPDDLAADFGEVDPLKLTLEVLSKGGTRRDVASLLGVPLAVVHEYVAQITREFLGQRGSTRERWALLDRQLDELTQIVRAALDEGMEATAPLVQALLGVHRLRGQIIAATTEQPRPRRDQS